MASHLAQIEAKGKGTKATVVGQGEMCVERVCGATFSVSILESKLGKKVAANPFSTKQKTQA